MRHLFILICSTVLIVGCSFHSQQYGPSGRMVNVIDCMKGMCLKDIGNVCGAQGYKIISEEKFRDLFGNHVRSIMMYECGQIRVASSSANGAEVYGTSFFINESGYLITNHHVIENCRNPALGYKTEIFPARVVAKDQILDLALLKVDKKNNNFLSLSDDKPEKLQRIIAAGYPFGKYISDDLKFTSGVVSSLKGPADDSTRLQVDAALNPGNSGGPIVDDASGLLVAVSVAGISKEISESIAFGIKSSSVIDFLNSNDIEYSTSSPTINPSRSSLAESLENSIGYVTCN